MAPGAGTTAQQLIDRLCALAQRQARLAGEAVAFAKYVDGLGVAGLQASGPQLSATADATDFLAKTDYLRTVGLVFTGGAVQTPAFDFSNALAAYIGPDPQE